jgi:hypothetical protein
MPIDASIALKGQPAQFESPMNAFANMLQIQSGQQANQMNQMKMAELTRAREQENAMNDIYRQAVKPDGTVDNNLLIQGMAQRGFGSNIPAIRKGMLEADEKALDVRKKGTEVSAAKMKGYKDLLPKVTTPQAYLDWFSGAYSDPDLQPIFDRIGLNPQAMEAEVFKAISKGPQGMQELLARTSMGADSLAEALMPKVSFVNAGDAQVPVNTNPMGGAIGPVPGATSIPITREDPTSVREYERAQRDPAFGQFLMAGKKAGASNTQVSINNAAGKSLAGPIGDRAEASLGAAESSVETMNNANMIRQALNSGKVIAGPLSGPRVTVGRLLELAGAGDKAQLQQTLAATKGLAALTLDARASLKGQGPVSNFETELLEKARSADINKLTVAELQKVVDIAQDVARRQWANHQNLLGTMQRDPNAQPVIDYYRPTAPLPAPVTQKGSGAGGLNRTLPQPGSSRERVLNEADRILRGQ